MAGSWFSQPITQMVKPLVKPFQGAPFRLAMVFVGLALLVGFLVELVYPPQDDLAAAQADLCEMLTYAMTKGGVGKEAGIIAAKSRIEARAKIDPSQTEPARAANERGRVALKNGRVAEAVQAFQAAYKANPRAPEIVENLGVAYWRQGDLQLAARYVLEALVLEPGRYTAWLSLGRVYAAQGHLREAVGCFAHAYRFNKGNKGITRKALERDRGNHKLGKAASQALELPMMQEDSK